MSRNNLNLSDTVSTFIELADTPFTYNSSAGKTVIVNSLETGLEFGDATSLPPVPSNPTADWYHLDVSNLNPSAGNTLSTTTTLVTGPEIWRELIYIQGGTTNLSQKTRRTDGLNTIGGSYPYMTNVEWSDPDSKGLAVFQVDWSVSFRTDNASGSYYLLRCSTQDDLNQNGIFQGGVGGSVQATFTGGNTGLGVNSGEYQASGSNVLVLDRQFDQKFLQRKY